MQACLKDGASVVNTRQLTLLKIQLWAAATSNTYRGHDAAIRTESRAQGTATVCARGRMIMPCKWQPLLSMVDMQMKAELRTGAQSGYSTPTMTMQLSKKKRTRACKHMTGSRRDG